MLLPENNILMPYVRCPFPLDLIGKGGVKLRPCKASNANNQSYLCFECTNTRSSFREQRSLWLIGSNTGFFFFIPSFFKHVPWSICRLLLSCSMCRSASHPANQTGKFHQIFSGNSVQRHRIETFISVCNVNAQQSASPSKRIAASSRNLQ